MRTPILDQDSAWQFINGYKKLLLEIYDGDESSSDGIVQKLISARKKLIGEPGLLQETQARLAAKSEAIDPEVFQAVQGLDVRKWTYLRDTKTYSIFMDTTNRRAFGVLGLTDRLRDALGGSGVVLETGLVRYRSRFVCDGLFVRSVWLGPNYKKSFNAEFAEWKAEGRFFVNCGG